MTGPARFHALEGGAVWAAPEAWAWLAAQVSAKARADAAANGGFSAVALDAVNAFSLAALSESTAPVSLPKPEQQVDETLFLSVEDEARRRGCSPQYVRRLASQNRIKAQRAGRCWLIQKPEGAPK